MTHSIPEDVLNSNIEYCINEYVRLVKHRDMLRDKWFHGLSIEEIANKYHFFVTATKDILYGVGDKVLLRAAKMKN